VTTWSEFAESAPEIAEAAHALLTVPGSGFGYLATVSQAGAPRIHPIMPVWAAGSMFAFIEPSPKLRDLARDGRYALHSTGSEDVDDELMVSGHAVEACAFAPGDQTSLVELLLDRVMWAHYEPRGVFPPQYRVWRDVDAG
jgi:hypothetical protein